MTESIKSLVRSAQATPGQVVARGTLIVSFSFMALIDDPDRDLGESILIKSPQLYRLAAKRFGKGLGGYMVSQPVRVTGAIRTYQGTDERFLAEFSEFDQVEFFDEHGDGPVLRLSRSSESGELTEVET